MASKLDKNYAQSTLKMDNIFDLSMFFIIISAFVRLSFVISIDYGINVRYSVRKLFYRYKNNLNYHVQ
jgi:hypothetical protein